MQLVCKDQTWTFLHFLFQRNRPWLTWKDGDLIPCASACFCALNGNWKTKPGLLMNNGKTIAPVPTTLSYWAWSWFNPVLLLPSIYSFRVCGEYKAALLGWVRHLGALCHSPSLADVCTVPSAAPRLDCNLQPHSYCYSFQASLVLVSLPGADKSNRFIVQLQHFFSRVFATLFRWQETLSYHLPALCLLKQEYQLGFGGLEILAGTFTVLAPHPGTPTTFCRNVCVVYKLQTKRQTQP